MKFRQRLKIPGSHLLFPLTLLSVLSLGWLAFRSAPTSITTICMAIASPLLLLLMWQSVVRPRRIVTRGIELLSGQDTNNRLAHTGQTDADRVADLFNTLMSRLHEEQIRLQEQESFLHLLIEASPMGVLMLDFDGLVSHYNPAFIRLAGIAKESPIHRLPLAKLPSPLAARLSAMTDGDVATFRMEDHSILRCTMQSFMERGFRRRFILLESLTREVMEAQRQAYGKVIRLMAHEVNNSMTGFITLLDLLGVTHESDADLSEFIRSVRDRCSSLGRFIGAYADVVRLPAPVPAPLRLDSFLTSQLPFLRSNTSWPLTLTVQGDIPSIRADADMLAQTLVNLIRNSSDAIRSAGHQDGRIEISLSPGTHGTVSLTVTDNGCGISPATADNLFSPFFSTKPEGQGIGLTMTAEILRRHDASFSLRTDPDGLTRFRILFHT